MEPFPDELHTLYEVHEWRNAYTVLRGVHPHEWEDLELVLRGLRLRRSYITVGGGNRSLVSRAIDGHFYSLGWIEKKFDTSIIVDETEYPSPTHAVDCYKNRVAIEVEWNNRDPFLTAISTTFVSCLSYAR